MKAEKVRGAFLGAGMEVPEIIERRLGDEYDLHESYCCGLGAVADSDGVLVWSYCHRGRGAEKKPVWMFWADGSWEERLRRPEDPMWVEPEPDYDDEEHV